MLTRLRALYATEPARLVALAVGLVLAAATQLGLVLDEARVWESVTRLAIVLLGGEATRAKVSPALPPNIGPGNDDLLPDQP